MIHCRCWSQYLTFRSNKLHQPGQLSSLFVDVITINEWCSVQLCLMPSLYMLSHPVLVVWVLAISIHGCMYIWYLRRYFILTLIYCVTRSLYLPQCICDLGLTLNYAAYRVTGALSVIFDWFQANRQVQLNFEEQSTNVLLISDCLASVIFGELLKQLLQIGVWDASYNTQQFEQSKMSACEWCVLKFRIACELFWNNCAGRKWDVEVEDFWSSKKRGFGAYI